MKKQLISLIFASLLINPCLYAGSLDTTDLQKISANKLENKALETGQGLVAFLATVGLLGTGLFGAVTFQLALEKEKGAAILSGGVTSILGVTTAALWAGWYKLFKKRAERHGYKNHLLKFWFLDLLAQTQHSHITIYT